MKIIPRVLHTAQLQDIKGSLVHRDKIVAGFSNDAFKWVSDVFKSRVNDDAGPLLGKSEIQDYLLQKYPTVLTRVGSEADSGWVGSVKQEIIGTKRSVASYSLNLTFDKDSKGQDCLDLSDVKRVEAFFHEHWHLGDYMAKPRIGAKVSTKECLFPDSSPVSDKIEKFYYNTLYFSNAKGIGKTVPKKERTQNIKKHIETFFTRNNFSSTEKIALLQYWRANLGSEIKAYKEGYNKGAKFLFETLNSYIKEGYPVKITLSKYSSYDATKIQPADRPKKWVSFCKDSAAFQLDALAKERFFHPKFKILNAMLASEIKDHRQKHAAQLKVKN